MKVVAKFEAALVNGKGTLVKLLESKNTISLKKIPVNSKIESPIPYRYESTDTLSSTFLLATNPGYTGMIEVMVVNQILEQIQDEGYKVDRTADTVTISALQP